MIHPSVIGLYVFWKLMTQWAYGFVCLGRPYGSVGSHCLAWMMVTTLQQATDMVFFLVGF
jgi:hypothetical protein